MKLIPRRRALPAALISALCATALAAGPSAAGTFGSEAARVVGTEQSALGAAAGLRVAALSEAARPPARAAEPAAAAALSKAPPTAGSATDSLPNAVSSADLNCLAQAIYFESRGEPLDGQIAVAEVVLNRVDDRRFPRTVCGVTNQGCQFSYTCDGNSDVMKSAESRKRSEKIAAHDALGASAQPDRRRDLLPHPLGAAGLVAALHPDHHDRPPHVLPAGDADGRRLTPAQSAKSCTR